LSPLEHFGVEVKVAREGRKLTQKHVADGTGYSVPYVSKVEHGVVMPSAAFAERLDVVIGTRGLFTRLRKRLAEVVTPSWVVSYLKLEKKATRIHDWSSTCLNGLLQTEDYARAICRAGNPHESPDAVEAMVGTRMQRYRDTFGAGTPLRLWAVIHEACLRTVVGGPSVMARQLGHLIELAQQPRIDIQVLPFAAGADAAHSPSFSVMTFADGTPASLWTDGPTGGWLVQTAATVDNARDIFERLRACALSPGESVRTIRTMMEELG
jgi:transcriptional regulator with XRE-family HTH domain